MRVFLMGLLAFVILSTASYADIIKKTDGNSINGTIMGEEGDQWVIDLGYGKILIPKKDVAAVKRVTVLPAKTQLQTQTQTQPQTGQIIISTPAESLAVPDEITPKSYLREGSLRNDSSDGVWDTDVKIFEVLAQTKKSKSSDDDPREHPKEALLMHILLWVVGFVLYSTLVYLIFRIVDDEKKYAMAPAFAAISLLFLYISSFFIFSQFYFGFANIMLVYLLYSFGFARAFLFGLFFTWIIQVTQPIFFYFP